MSTLGAGNGDSRARGTHPTLGDRIRTIQLMFLH
jgi:hypothetical protein